MKNIKLIKANPKTDTETANITISGEFEDGVVFSKTIWASGEYWAAKIDGMLTIIEVLNKLNQKEKSEQ